MNTLADPASRSATQVEESVSAQAAETCPSSSEISHLLAKKTKHFEHQKALLNSFLAGEFFEVFDANIQLDTNLADPKRVASRLAELRGHLSSNQLFEDTEFQRCLAKIQSLSTGMEQYRALKRIILEIKIEILSLPEESRTLLLNALQEYQQQRAIAVELEEKKAGAMQAQQESERQTIEAEAQSIQPQDQDKKLLASARALLEERKTKIANFHLKWVSEAELRLKLVNDAADKLAELSARLAKMSNFEEVNTGFQDSNKLWHELSKRIYHFYSRTQTVYDIPDLPEQPKGLLKKYKDLPIAIEYQNSYATGLELRQQVLNDLNSHLERENENDYRLLLSISKLRSKFLKKLNDFPDQVETKYDQAYWLDLVNEIKVIPYRGLAIVYEKTIEFHQYLQQGSNGIFIISQQIFLLLLFLSLPVFIWYALNKVVNGIDGFREWLIRNHARNHMARTVAIWIPKINKFLPWITIILAVYVVQIVFRQQMFSEVLVFLPYVLYYVYYRLIREIVQILFVFIAQQANMQSYNVVRRKIAVSSRRIGLLYFFTFTVLHTIKSIVSEGYLYFHAIQLGVLVWSMVLIWIFSSWRIEIRKALDGKTNDPVSLFITKYMSGLLSYLMVFIAVAWLLLRRVIERAANPLSELDVSKRLQAQLFRRQVGKEAKDKLDHGDYELPKEYRALYSFGVPEDESLLVKPEGGLISEIKSEIVEWECGDSDENSLVIYGENGSGKSCSLRLLELELPKLIFINVVVPPKLTSDEEVYRFIGQLFNIELNNDGKALTEFDKTAEKTIVLLDECQNLFLSKVGGFDGFRLFLEIINMRLTNIFWCMAFNLHSWRFLHDVFGKHRFFRVVKRLEPWSEDAIRDMIMLRHRRSEYKLSFDQIIAATKITNTQQDFSKIEEKFFTLLWEQSNGNPRTAIYYWLLSLKPIKNKVLRVGLPEATSRQVFSDMLDDLFFVYAAIARHENLTTHEVADVTNLSTSIVRHALKIGLERNFIHRSKDQRYRITEETQDLLLKYLSTKNFLSYGY